MKPYVKNAWYVAGWTTDLPERIVIPISILGESIAIYRTPDGSLVALQDRCVHRMAPLSLGRCEGRHLRCMYHGLLFDIDGQVVEIPGQATIPPQARVRTFPVVERHSWIWIWMGDAALADDTLIPPAVGLDQPDWILGHGQLDYAAEARLINDNLLDFSHLSFVHAKSFGAGDEWAKDRPTITALPRGVRFERWLVNTKRMMKTADDGLIDMWSSYDFIVPGILLMWSGAFPTGTAQAHDFKRPDYSTAVANVTFTSQAVTPLTAQTSRYFFSWGPHRHHGDEALRDILMNVAAMAFGEDKTMIEAQQHVINRTPSPSVMPTTADRGITIYNQMVNRLIRGESSSHDNAVDPTETRGPVAV